MGPSDDDPDCTALVDLYWNRPTLAWKARRAGPPWCCSKVRLSIVRRFFLDFVGWAAALLPIYKRGWREQKKYGEESRQRRERMDGAESA